MEPLLNLGWGGFGQRPLSPLSRGSAKPGKGLLLRPGSVGRRSTPRRAGGKTSELWLPPTKSGLNRPGASSGDFGAMVLSIP
eukprot:1071729-Alexandrium_andersonii.AAC.1